MESSSSPQSQQVFDESQFTIDNYDPENFMLGSPLLPRDQMFTTSLITTDRNFLDNIMSDPSRSPRGEMFDTFRNGPDMKNIIETKGPDLNADLLPAFTAPGTGKRRPEEGLKETSQFIPEYSEQNTVRDGTRNPYAMPFVSQRTQNFPPYNQGFQNLFRSPQVNGIIESNNNMLSLTLDQNQNLSNEVPQMLKSRNRNIGNLVDNRSSMNTPAFSPNTSEHLKAVEERQKHQRSRQHTNSGLYEDNNKDLSKREGPNQNDKKIKETEILKKEKVVFEEEPVHNELTLLAIRLKSWLQNILYARVLNKSWTIMTDDPNISDLAKLIELIVSGKGMTPSLSQNVFGENLEEHQQDIGSQKIVRRNNDAGFSFNLGSNYVGLNRPRKIKQNPIGMTVEEETKDLDPDGMRFNPNFTNYLFKPSLASEFQTKTLEDQFARLDPLMVSDTSFLLENDQNFLKENNPYLNPITFIRLMAKYHHRKAHLIKEKERKLIEHLSEYEKSEEFRSSNQANWIELIKYVEKKHYPKKIAKETGRKVKAEINMNLASHIGEVLYILLLKKGPCVFGFESEVDEMDLTFLKDNDAKQQVFKNFMLLFKDQCATKNIVRPLMHFLAALYLDEGEFKTSNEDEIKLMTCVKNYQSENNWTSLRIYLGDTYITEPDLVNATKLLARMLNKILYREDILEKLREKKSKMSIKSKLLFENEEDKNKLYQAFYLEVAFSREDFQGDDKVYEEGIVGDLVHAMARYFILTLKLKTENTDELFNFLFYLQNLNKNNINWTGVENYIKKFSQRFSEGLDWTKLVQLISNYEDKRPVKFLTPALSKPKSQMTWAWVFGHLLCEFIFQPELRNMKDALKPIKSYAQYGKVLSLFEMRSDYDIAAKYNCLKFIYQNFRECYNGMMNYLRHNENYLGNLAQIFLNKEISWQQDETSGPANNTLETSEIQQDSQPASHSPTISNLPVDPFQEQNIDNEGRPQFLRTQSRDEFFSRSVTTRTWTPNPNKRVKPNREGLKQQNNIDFELYKNDIDDFLDKRSPN